MNLRNLFCVFLTVFLCSHILSAQDSSERNHTTLIPSARSLDLTLDSHGEHSVARIWNEVLLHAIRKDFARPTVHARNLFHSSLAFYDIWAVYNGNAKPYLIGNTINGFTNDLDSFNSVEPISDSMDKAISYAAFNLLNSRFKNSPGYEDTKILIDQTMTDLGYDSSIVSQDYQSGDPAAFGNYVAQIVINYGNDDGSRELTGYDNAFYNPVNDPLNPEMSGNPTITDPNRWQPLSLDTFIDQSGNVITGDVIDFLSPEWGSVSPFCLKQEDKSILLRNSQEYTVYLDPGNPPYINESVEDPSSEYYKWGFSLVSAWGSHLDPSDGVMWDISPASIGNLNIDDLPTNYENYPEFYDLENGGDNSSGRLINEVTGLPYTPNIVPRGDYARVLAEFWADGPDSETPPGHWFTLFNYINDNPQLEKRFSGQGAVLSDLEWDVKGYLVLGGAMHDSAIAAWGIKGFYDYIRPISAIRYMIEKGQSSDPTHPTYDVAGIPLIDGLIELVKSGDPLAGSGNQNIGKIKLYSWKGPDYISNPDTDEAGVGWILGDDWWPYQRPSFVTPPFAGFVSGHSTYSRAAAEVLTLLTGSEYFPGGMGEFVAKQNEFLVFEEGPSQDIVLQWATYRDASDQCSLSRIWGGIHPPADDLDGRRIGYTIGNDAFNFALPLFNANLGTNQVIAEDIRVFPNPVQFSEVFVTNSSENDIFKLVDIQGRHIPILDIDFDGGRRISKLSLPQSLTNGIYILQLNNASKILAVKSN